MKRQDENVVEADYHQTGRSKKNDELVCVKSRYVLINIVTRNIF